MVKIVPQVSNVDQSETHHVVKLSIYMAADGSVDEVVVHECSIPGSDMAFDGLLEEVSQPLVDKLREWAAK